MAAIFQLKVEYGHERLINFFLDANNVYGGQYKFGDLVSDILNRCPSLSHLTQYNIRIRYQDDEGSYVNLDFGDEPGFAEMWANAKRVPDREYKRVKIKGCEINSPCGIIAPNVENTNTTMLLASNKQSRQRKSSSTMQPRQLYMSSFDKTDKNYEDLFDERGKKQRVFSDDSETDSESEFPNLMADNIIKTPVERLFDNLETNIAEINQDIARKTEEVNSLKQEVNSARERNQGVLTVCGQCHLRDGHTKRNCELGLCESATYCGLIDRHPVDKGRVRKLESELTVLQKKLKTAQESYKTKKTAYSKVNDSFIVKVEHDLILTDPQLYVQNGCKNWSLIHKHAAILEKECKGKLPKRRDIPQLLKNSKGYKDFENYAGKQYDSFSCLSAPPKTGNTTAINPAMADLQRHGIVFPKHKSPCLSSTTLYRCIPSNAEEEREQLNMMLKQSMLDQSQLTCYSVKAPPFLTRQSEPKPANTFVPDDRNIVENSDVHESAVSDVQSENKDVERDSAAEVLVSLMGMKKT